MTLNRVKLGHTVTFLKYVAQRSLFDISTEDFNLE